MNQVSASARRHTARPAIDTIKATSASLPVNPGVRMAFCLYRQMFFAFVA
ncbi:hypothetical protein [Silvimonas amylolytica]|nr:hypothetical protein [Silvimonas amylolytica]